MRLYDANGDEIYPEDVLSPEELGAYRDFHDRLKPALLRRLDTSTEETHRD